MDAPRELFIAMPSGMADFYRQHQDVWRAVAPVLAVPRVRFIYRMQGQRLARVRSTAFQRGIVTPVREGMMCVDLVAKRRASSDGAIYSVEDSTLEEWLTTLLSRHGFAIERLDQAIEEKVVGFKPQTLQKLWLPIRRVRFRLRITDRLRAEMAWVNGVGHGKRFGFGMLTPA